MRCFNEDTAEYQRLKQIAQASGISEFKLRAYVSSYYDKFNAFPSLYLIPNIDSESYIRKELEIKTNKDISKVSKDKLLEYTGATTAEEAVAKLNNMFSDKEIYLGPELAGSYIIHIDRRASIYEDVFDTSFDFDTILKNNRVVANGGKLEKTSSVGILNNIIKRLSERHGVQIKEFTNESIDDALLKEVPNAKQVNAFIYNGTIYINTDVAKADAPLHELLHLILGQVRYKNPKLYTQLLDSLTSLPNFKVKIDQLRNNSVYADRTQSDLIEELLVTDFARTITDPTYKGIFENDNKLFEQVFQNVMYAIDTILLPSQSVQSQDYYKTLNADLVTLSKRLGSALIMPTYNGTLNIEDEISSRRISNLKQQLIHNGFLREEC